VTFLFLSDTLK